MSDRDDITVRLRALLPSGLAAEAISEIARLRAEVERLRAIVAAIEHGEVDE